MNHKAGPVQLGVAGWIEVCRPTPTDFRYSTNSNHQECVIDCISGSKSALFPEESSKGPVRRRHGSDALTRISFGLGVKPEAVECKNRTF